MRERYIHKSDRFVKKNAEFVLGQGKRKGNTPEEEFCADKVSSKRRRVTISLEHASCVKGFLFELDLG